MRQHPGVIEAIIVGNEALLRGELGPERIKTYLEEVRRRGKLPVTYADVWEFWLKAPELAQAADFVTIHILPYWEDHPVRAEDAAEHVAAVRGRMAEAFPGKEILIGEVGWPSQGRMRAGALPSPANQALVLGGVAEAAKQGGWKVNLIEAFDQPWKRMLEGTVGGYWGLFDGDARAPKFRFGEPVSNHPHWRLVAALGIGAALLVFAAAWLGLQGREPMAWGTGFAVAAIATVSRARLRRRGARPADGAAGAWRPSAIGGHAGPVADRADARRRRARAGATACRTGGRAQPPALAVD